MAAPSHATLQLAAADPETRRRRIRAAYRRTGSLERTAAELTIPTRTLARWLDRDPVLARELADIRQARA